MHMHMSYKQYDQGCHISISICRRRDVRVRHQIGCLYVLYDERGREAHFESRESGWGVDGKRFDWLRLH